MRVMKILAVAFVIVTITAGSAFVGSDAYALGNNKVTTRK